MKTFWLLVFVAFRLISSEIDPAILAQIEPYLLTNTELLKKLDKIFLKNRVLTDRSSLENAGFYAYGAFHTSGVHVLKHKKLKNYLVKCFTDDFVEKLDWQHFLYRIKGAEYIHQAILYRNAGHYMKVPHKWIYKIPSIAPQGPHHFILVVEDMKICGRKKNREKWKNEVKFDLLYCFYHVINDAGAADCNFVDNAPFSEDGKIAFVDTEIYHRWPINFEKLTHYLSPANRHYWHHLYSSGGIK